MRSGTILGAALVITLAALLQSGTGRGEEETANHQVKIGIVNSLFKDTPPALMGVLSRPLKALMEAQTGVSGDLQLAGDAFDLASKLKKNELQLGVFHGFEFAWAQQQYPELKPLVISVAHHRLLHAHLVVKKDSPASSAGDLKGQTIALPAVSRAHLHLYLERRCPAPGSDPKKFFARIARPGDPEDALDDVVDGVVQGAIVERLALDRYQQNKPARAEKLRVLNQSETFPASVIAYYPGSLEETILKRFREGLVTADRSERSRELLKMCRITGFEEVPADYEQLLLEIARAYPAPITDREKK